VKSLDARQQAIKIAWNAPGVQSVINALEVQDQAQMPARSDDQ
jgi:osmotically-inducible protein OsmY